MTTKVKGSSFNIIDSLVFANILDYGARADGVTICNTALTTAFATGYPVFIPAGTFLINAFTIPDNKILFGVGTASILKAAAVTNATLLRTGTRAKLKSFAIDGNKTNQVGSGFHGVQLSDTVGTSIQDLLIYNTNGNGIYVTGTGTAGLSIRGVEVTGHAASGILVDSGTDIQITNSRFHTSDILASPGHGISISSAGNTISEVLISGCRTTNNAGSGIIVKGNGSKNVTDVSISNVISATNTLNGIHAHTTERIAMSACVAKTNTVDGIRIEGDVQNSRVAECISNGNAAFGIREIVSGSTPNYNGFLYNVSTGNGTNTVTKVGANSTVVSI